MPSVVKSSSLYNDIILILDTAVGELSDAVLSYERQILQATACWREEQGKRRQRPRKCPTGYEWDGNHACRSVSTLLSISATKLDSSVQDKSAEGSLPAHCDVNAGFP